MLCLSQFCFTLVLMGASKTFAAAAASSSSMALLHWVLALTPGAHVPVGIVPSAERLSLASSWGLTPQCSLSVLAAALGIAYWYGWLCCSLHTSTRWSRLCQKMHMCRDTCPVCPTSLLGYLLWPSEFFGHRWPWRARCTVVSYTGLKKP